MRQEVTPPHLLGRVTSAFWTVHNSLGPVGAAAVTACVARFSVEAVTPVMGVLVVVIAVSALFTPLCRAPVARPAGGQLQLGEG